MNPHSPLVFHLCSLSPGQTTWSATIAIEGDLSSSGLLVNIFYQGQKVQGACLDEWGYVMMELSHLKPPVDLSSTVYFEARTLSPPMQIRSVDFHPPLVYQSIRTHLETFKSWPKHLPLKGVDLQNANLSGVDLSGINLHGANLSGAKLWKCNLEKAVLKNAILSNADLSYANLTHTDLENTKIHNTSLEKAHFKETDIRGMRGLSLGDLMTIHSDVYMDDRQKKAYQIGLDRQSASQQSASQQSASQQSASQQSASQQSASQQSASHGSSRSTERMPSDTASHHAASHHTMSNVYSNTMYGKSINKSKLQDITPKPGGYYKSPSSSDKLNQANHNEDLPYAPRLPEQVMSARAKADLAQSVKQRSERYIKYAQNRSLRGELEFQLLLIPNGSFQMGRDDLDPFMRPRHEVEINYPFFMGTTVVTQALYKKVMGGGRFKFPGDNKPAESVSWIDAINFCNRLSVVEGLEKAYNINEKGIQWQREANGYRLPTEAEWEYAANGGVPFKYAGSDDVSEVAWFQENSKGSTQDVKQKKPNSWGIYDMSGNVWEWCFDLFLENAYHSRNARGTTNPIVDGVEGSRVIKGGSWSYEPEGLEVSYRKHLATHFKTSRIGFRIARSPKLKKK
jgi:formylglycine-generating enzyme